MHVSHTSLVLVIAAFGTSIQAWKLNFHGTDKQYLNTHGTADVDCNNLASTFTEKVEYIEFDPATDWHTDPTWYTAYSDTGCSSGSKYTHTGRKGKENLSPEFRVKSYKLH